MIIKSMIFALSIFISLVIIGCNSQTDSFAPDDNPDPNLYKYSVIESDLSLLKEGGMPPHFGDGVFSIGWNEMFRPFNQNSDLKGMAFAVAFNDANTGSPHFPRFGIDMGTIKIQYDGNEVEMFKFSHPRRGTAYSLFQPPFGESENLLNFIPSTDYVFNISGSGSFNPLTITLTSPPALLDITSHNQGDPINPADDLHITWSGGNPQDKIALRITSFMFPPRGLGGFIRPPLFPPDNFFVIVLENNSGEYTLSSQQLQRILAGGYSDKLVIDISQLDFGEVQHDGKIFHTSMRNGTSVALDVP